MHIRMKHHWRGRECANVDSVGVEKVSIMKWAVNVPGIGVHTSH